MACSWRQQSPGKAWDANLWKSRAPEPSWLCEARRGSRPQKSSAPLRAQAPRQGSPLGSPSPGERSRCCQRGFGLQTECKCWELVTLPGEWGLLS